MHGQPLGLPARLWVLSVVKDKILRALRRSRKVKNVSRLYKFDARAYGNDKRPRFGQELEAALRAKHERQR